MSNFNNSKRRQGQGEQEKPATNPPTHVAKVRTERGDTASFERIGVAWAKENGSIFIRLHGTQIVTEGFTLYPIEEGGAR
jgi:hypothetical protein